MASSTSTKPISETKATDGNNKREMTEAQQEYWNRFWRSPEGIKIIKILTGIDKREREWRESNERTEAILREATEFSNLLQSCMKHNEPIFTLELPDEILLKLTCYGSVGEILFGFKLNKESRQRLATQLGEVGLSLVGSRLISRGYLKPNDPIFQDW